MDGVIILEILQQLANGLALGSAYALIALGYTMVYGIIQLINFAHGEFFMIGAYAGVLAIKAGLPLYAAFPAAITAGALISAGVEKIAYKPLRKKNSGRLAALITAIGISIFLQNVIFLIPGADLIGLGTKNPMGIEKYVFGSVEISGTKVYIFLISIILMIIFIYIVHFTKSGKAMRAVSADRDTAMLMGIDPDRIISFTFALGGALAGAAGLLFALDQNQVSNFMGLMPGLKAFIAAVIGGIGSIPRAMAGGLILGLMETLAVVLGFSQFKDAFAFIFLIIILILKPAGIFAMARKEKV